MRRISLLALFVSALAPSAARADDTAPALRLGAGTNLFTWTGTTTDLGGMHQENDGYAIGILSPSLSLDVGALVTPWLAFGVVGQGAYTSHATSGGNAESFTYQALAYVEASYRVDVARPFARLYGGVSGSETQTTISSVFSPGPSTPATTGSSVVEGAVGGAIGVHCLVTPDFSISPYVAALYLAGSGQTAGSPSMSYSIETISLQVGVTFLGWID